MTRHLSSTVFIVCLTLPAAAWAQHTNSGGAPAVSTASPSGGGGSSSGSSGGSSGGSSSSSSSGDSGSFSPGSSGRRAGNNPAIGTAARGSVPGSGGTIVITEGSGFYPWGYGYDGGVLAGGYFGGYYGAYDPWYGWFPTYAPAAYGGPDDTGGLRIKVKPNDASVYVDGFYVGVVDDFDNAFQKLKLEPGPHHIEIRAPQHTPLAVDVMIQEDFTITYRGELTKQ